MEKIKVLQIKSSLSSDGSTSILLSWAKELVNKVQFDILLTEEGHDDWKHKFEKLGGKVYCIPLANGQGNKVKNRIKEKKQYIEFLKKNDYSIIHIHTENMRRSRILKYAYLAGVKGRIIHSHNSLCQNLNGLNKYKIVREFRKKEIKKYATELLACSNIAAEWLFPKECLNKAIIIKNGINVDRFKFDIDKRQKYRKTIMNDDYFLIGNVGRFSKQKNHKFIIQIMEKLTSIDNNIRLFLIGNGELKEDIIKQIQECQLEEYIYILESTDIVENYMNAMDMFLFPSLFEGLGIVAIEAQTSGLPCIVSNNVPNEVKISKNIEFIPLEKNIEYWCNEILDIKKNVDKIDRVNAWRDTIISGYDVSTSAEELLKIYSHYIKENIENEN